MSGATFDVTEIGREKAKVICIDNALLDPDSAIQLAASLAPFPEPPKGTYYPGLRRPLDMNNWQESGYALTLTRLVTPLVKQTYGYATVTFANGSFSVVTQSPESLSLPQRLPHFDDPAPNHLALLHYLSRSSTRGTAMYRHRRTGFEMITLERFPEYSQALDEDLKTHGEPAGYADVSTEIFEQIAAFEGVFNRVLIYPVCQLHSGLVEPDFTFDPDPVKGRLTGNLFLTLTNPTSAAP